MKIINQIDVNNKNVLIRIDGDVPIENGVVIDDERLQASVPTLRYLIENNAKITIIGHIGRPNGKEVSELKMRPVEDKLIELLGTHQNWQILENLRFNLGEEENDPEFSKLLSTGQDLFIQDAFATCHRAHASTVGVAKLLPTYAGFSVQREVENLSKILESSDGFTIIIGGKKAETKLPVIKNLSQKCENFLLGGVVANTFLAACDYYLGKSLIEKEVLKEAREIIKNLDDQIKLPQDLVFSESLEKEENLKTLALDNLLDIDNSSAVDVGIKTIKEFAQIIADSKTIFFNGNMGISEIEEFSHGTLAITKAIVDSPAKKYAGGGDTTSFIRQHNLEDKFDFLSIGGGATLEFLAGKTLPGLEVLG
ncbi:MAG: phosphoglycerate kinase [Patescibacteria group bacterium]